MHISNFNTLLTLDILVSDCQCDDRGTQINDNYGNWCWTTENACKQLNGVVLTGVTWVRCHDQGNPNSQELIKCKTDILN